MAGQGQLQRGGIALAQQLVNGNLPGAQGGGPVAALPGDGAALQVGQQLGQQARGLGGGQLLLGRLVQLQVLHQARMQGAGQGHQAGVGVMIGLGLKQHVQAELRGAGGAGDDHAHSHPLA